MLTKWDEVGDELTELYKVLWTVIEVYSGYTGNRRVTEKFFHSERHGL